EPNNSREITEGTEYFKPADTIDYSEDRVRIEIEVPSEGYLVLSDLHYPGWQAMANQKAVPIHRVNGVFRGIYLPSAGRYEILFWYDPAWKSLVWITVFSALATLLVPGLLFGSNFLPHSRRRDIVGAAIFILWFLMVFVNYLAVFVVPNITGRI
ncbi:MAG: hypothetical protein NC930_09435, partial [Candidatus Omnitrophica bacterium]|nr:hypothetical protein [Candidatus Omnitrophota bacterium]